MNLDFLGDALDHWKGSLFESLMQAQVLQNFKADPMVSDPDRWREEDWELYSRLLRIEREQIVQHRVTLRDGRAGYFRETSHHGDLFLDPDTGVATGRVREPQRYVSPSEVGQLLDSSTHRLLIVYQHVLGKVARRVDEVMKTLQCQIGGFAGCWYESGTVAMLFLARSPARTAQVEEHFATLLGRHAPRRIRRF